MKHLFVEKRTHYNLRVANDTYSRKPNTTAYGIESVSFLGQKLWRELPLHIKNSQTLQGFKTALKNWNFPATADFKDIFGNLGLV